jgi:alpha-beta hydrolase superfamily lysophospholipase
MQHQTGTYTGADGLSLYYQSWRPDGAPRAAIILVHGLGGHSAASMGITLPLVAAGCAVWAPDLRGHGRSPGPRGHVGSWAEFRADLRRFEALVSAAEPGLPRLLIGHSLGGLMSVDYALHHPEGLAGLALICPAVDPKIPGWKRILVRSLARLAPTFAIAEKADYTRLTDNPDVRAEIAADPLRHNLTTIGIGAAVLETSAWVWANAGRNRLPVLLQYAGADSITPPEGIARFGEVLGGPKQLKLYPDLRHRPFDDHAGRIVVDDLLAWVAERLA